MISDSLGIPVRPIRRFGSYKSLWNNRISNRILRFEIRQRLYETCEYVVSAGRRYLTYNIGPYLKDSEFNALGTLPVLVDYWKGTSPCQFARCYRKCEPVRFSSFESLAYVKQSTGIQCEHFPYSIPDHWVNPPLTERVFEICVVGRTSPVLYQWLDRFTNSHPQVNVVIAHLGDDKVIMARSSRLGVIGEVNSRTRYFDMLRSSKVALYSTPGMDGGEVRTGGFSPVTPKFLEFIASGCEVVARYHENADTEFFELDQVAWPAKTYRQFERSVEEALERRDEERLIVRAKYIQRHLTSQPIALLSSL